MQTLTTEALERIRNSSRVLGLIMALFNKSYHTILRWIDNKDVRLTLPAVLAILREEFKLSDQEILEEEKAVA